MKGIKENMICMIGLWFLSSALPLIYIYVSTKFHCNPFCTFQDMARTGNPYVKWLRGDNSINIQGLGLWFVGSALPLIAIYLYTKLYLNATSSFGVICRTKYRTDRRTDKAATIMCFPLW